MDVWFQRERFEALLAVIIMEHRSRSAVLAENDIETEI
jgi:hypothetical protein